MDHSFTPDFPTLLVRASMGHQFSVSEVETLLAEGPHNLDSLLDVASELRDLGLQAANRPEIITYSKKVFIPLTTLCRDRCHYCVFVNTPGQLAKKRMPLYMSPQQILQVAKDGAALGCKEALFTLGDRPEDRWPEARAWLREHGYESTLHYVRAMAELVLTETGLLPHLNPGVMSAEEMVLLRPVAPSMGMMLETTSHRLWAEKGQVHFGSPDKDPALRLGVLEDAGWARIPLTTGILVGIGENTRERAESLVAIRDSHARHGHLQEVIVQNFRAKPGTAMRNRPDLETLEYVTTVAVARLVLGAGARIQAPPNLSDADELDLLVRSGIDDWGGVSPLTPDHVNPERPWPQIDVLDRLTRNAGFELKERLTVHPPYIRDANTWIDPSVEPHVRALADPVTLLGNEANIPRPRVVPRPTRSLGFPSKVSRIRSSILLAESDPSSLSDSEYESLFSATGEDLDLLTAVANNVRGISSGEAITYVINRNITSSNLLEESTPADASRLTLRMLQPIVDDAWTLGATEICIQGVIPEHLPPHSYLDIIHEVKAAKPEIHLHAFRPSDLADGAARLQISTADFIERLVAAGLDSIPGTGVKILDESVRARVAPQDINVARWISIIKEAHRAGLRSTAVMVYGLGETAANRVAHLRTLARIQDETGGFTEFVPMPAFGMTLPSGRTASDEHRAVHAVSRLMLHGKIENIQVPWTRLGLELATVMLKSGANDLGGVLLDGRVLPEMGVEFGKHLRRQDIDGIARALSRPTRQRTTIYTEPDEARKAAWA